MNPEEIKKGLAEELREIFKNRQKANSDIEELRRQIQSGVNREYEIAGALKALELLDGK